MELDSLDERISHTIDRISIDRYKMEFQQRLNEWKRPLDTSDLNRAFKYEFTFSDTITEKIKGLSKSRDTLNKQKNQYYWKLADLKFAKPFKIESIIMEINEGFIENLLIFGTVEEYEKTFENFEVDGDSLKKVSRKLKFENTAPIGFSRKLDYDLIKNIKLYTRGGDSTQYDIRLEEVLDAYIQTHAVGRRDYSPANQIVNLRKEAGQTESCRELKKAPTYRLLEAKVFSDFVGLDATEPNGLLQTEINKRINLWTNRKPLPILGLERNNYGWLSFVEPSLTLSKIEDHNRYLELDYLDRFTNNQYDPLRFTSTLSLKQYENFSVGLDANLFLYDMPNFKSTLYFNWGIRYGRTAIRDSIRTVDAGDVSVDLTGVQEYGVNTLSHYPEITWSIYEDERYGFSVSWRRQWFYLRDNRFAQVGNTETRDVEDRITNPRNSDEQFSRSVLWRTWNREATTVTTIAKGGFSSATLTTGNMATGRPAFTRRRWGIRFFFWGDPINEDSIERSDSCFKKPKYSTGSLRMATGPCACYRKNHIIHLSTVIAQELEEISTQGTSATLS
jgi:hypothetical protein